MEYITNRITLDDQLCNRKPTIRGKRITVQTILEFLGAGESREEILRNILKPKTLMLASGLPET